MKWHLSEKEQSSVVALPGAKRYSYCIKRITDWETVWSLRGDSGWVLASDPNGAEVVPVWPHPAFAQSCATGDWAGSEATAIDLKVWLDRWVPGMISDERSVAVFPTANDRGVVVEAKRFRDDITYESEQYG